VSDVGVMGAIADAFMADYLESFQQLQMELEQHKPSEEDPNRWTYPALRASVQAVCNASDAHIKQLFHCAVEFSRACTQAENPPMPLSTGGDGATLKAPSYQAPAHGGQLTEHVPVLENEKFAEASEEDFAKPRKYKTLSYGGDLLPEAVIILAACQTGVLEAATDNLQTDTPRSAPSATADEAKAKSPPKKSKK